MIKQVDFVYTRARSCLHTEFLAYKVHNRWNLLPILRLKVPPRDTICLRLLCAQYAIAITHRSILTGQARSLKDLPISLSDPEPQRSTQKQIFPPRHPQTCRKKNPSPSTIPRSHASPKLFMGAETQPHILGTQPYLHYLLHDVATLHTRRQHAFGRTPYASELIHTTSLTAPLLPAQ